MSSGGCLLWGVCSGECLLWGGVSALGGVCSRGCLLGGVCSWGVSAPEGVCSQGVPSPRGVSAPDGCIPGCTEADTPMLTESQTPVKTLPWPNFVAAGNNFEFLLRFKSKLGKSISIQAS